LVRFHLSLHNTCPHSAADSASDYGSEGREFESLWGRVTIEYEKVKQIVRDILRDEDYRGGPLQRQYAPAVIEAIAIGVAGRIEEEIEEEAVED
jgi:hypothetical protein